MADARKASTPSAAPYFTDQKKGEVNELKALLRNINVERDPKRKRDVLKKVIAYMTLGIDVSRLFSEMVMAIDTRDLVIKKMVYLYLCNYASSNPDLAIMCINTLITDCRNEDPMVRGLALRSLCSLRLDSIVEYIQEPLQVSLTDNSAYVRKTAVMGILKLHNLAPETTRDMNLVDTLYNMMQDRDTQVVVNCIHVLNEMLREEGGMAVNGRLMAYLLNRIKEFNEWGQCAVLDLLPKYSPSGQDEVFHIMNILDECLRVNNSGVVLATAKNFVLLTEEMPDLHWQVFQRLKTPMLTLLASGSFELQYCVLKHMLLLVQRCPGAFADEFRQFYTRYNEPTHVKYLKVEILALVATGANMGELVSELSEYVSDVDADLARRAIRAIGTIATAPADRGITAEGSEAIFQQLVDFLDLDVGYVRAEAAACMKDLLRKFPDRRGAVLPALQRCLRRVDEADAKASVIWIVGEFGEDITEAPYMLEPIIDGYEDETSITVRAQLLTASMKLFFKRPPEMQAMLGRLLTAAIEDTACPDLHDRALMYYRLLASDPSAASAIVNASKPAVVAFAEEDNGNLRDTLLQEFNSLSVIYDSPSYKFIDAEHQAAEFVPSSQTSSSSSSRANGGGGNADGGGAAASSQEDNGAASADIGVGMGATTPSNGNGSGPAVVHADLLDLDFLSDAPLPAASMPALSASPAATSYSLLPGAVMAAGVFQTEWGALQECASASFSLHSSLTSLAQLEGTLSACHVLTVASGDTGPALKLFCSAQGSDGAAVLAEVNVNKAEATATASVRSVGGAVSAEGFLGLLQQSLSS